MNSDLFELIEVHGSDLTVVNAARVSMGKRKAVLDEADARLIKYLARHGHMSPFRHCSMTARVTLPIFVMRQWQKHRIGMEINEISGRYVEFDETRHWTPDTWRMAAPNVKQGSSNEVLTGAAAELATSYYAAFVAKAFHVYRKLLEIGVCKEQARTVLPLSIMTECVVTASLEAWHWFYKKRSAPDAQFEIREYAHEVDVIMAGAFPVSWAALREYV